MTCERLAARTRCALVTGRKATGIPQLPLKLQSPSHSSTAPAILMGQKTLSIKQRITLPFKTFFSEHICTQRIIIHI